MLYHFYWIGNEHDSGIASVFETGSTQDWKLFTVDMSKQTEILYDLMIIIPAWVDVIFMKELKRAESNTQPGGGGNERRPSHNTEHNEPSVILQ